MGLAMGRAGAGNQWAPGRRPGLGTFPILFGYISYRIRILMYLAYICKGNQDTCGIHPRYIMRYMYLKFIQTDMYLIYMYEGDMRDT